MGDVSLLDRINWVINTDAFSDRLGQSEVDLIEFQCDWHQAHRKGLQFNQLSSTYQEAILAGEAGLSKAGLTPKSATAATDSRMQT